MGAFGTTALNVVGMSVIGLDASDLSSSGYHLCLTVRSTVRVSPPSDACLTSVWVSDDNFRCLQEQKPHGCMEFIRARLIKSKTLNNDECLNFTRLDPAVTFTLESGGSGYYFKKGPCPSWGEGWVQDQAAVEGEICDHSGDHVACAIEYDLRGSCTTETYPQDCANMLRALRYPDLGVILSVESLLPETLSWGGVMYMFSLREMTEEAGSR